MPLVTAKSLLAGQIGWEYRVDHSPYAPTRQKDTYSFRHQPPATFDYAIIEELSIVPGGVTTVDLYGPTTVVFTGESVTAVRLCGFWLKVTGEDGVLRIEPGDTNPLYWPFASGGRRVLTPGEDGACWVPRQGSAVTVSNTAKTWKFSNTGTARITVLLVAFVGD